MKIFWSYAKLDNKEPRRLTKLRRAFNSALDQTTGSLNQVIVDDDDLRWGAEWKKEIESLIRSSDAIIAIISPSYFNSRMCVYELLVASENRIRILPLYYRDCKNGLESRFKEEESEENVVLNNISKKTREVQYKDYRKLRNKKLVTEDVQNFLDDLANEIA